MSYSDFVPSVNFKEWSFCILLVVVESLYVVEGDSDKSTRRLLTVEPCASDYIKQPYTRKPIARWLSETQTCTGGDKGTFEKWILAQEGGYFANQKARNSHAQCFSWSPHSTILRNGVLWASAHRSLSRSNPLLWQYSRYFENFGVPTLLV